MHYRHSADSFLRPWDRFSELKASLQGWLERRLFRVVPCFERWCLARYGRPIPSALPARVVKVQEYMKNKIQNQKSIYTFGRSQIAQGDVREFLVKFDPARLSNDKVRELFGTISFIFEDIEKREVHTHSELRILLRRLHAIWPWSAFFLNLTEPLGPDVGTNKKPLLALALCVADRPFNEVQLLNVVKPQLRRVQFRSHEAMNRLGKRVGIPTRTIEARHRAIDRQFQPFLKDI
jgi:hypothetical protein